MLNSNENQNSSPKVILPTDTTSNQVEAINKNSIESETEQSLQSSLADSQDSLANYVDSREESPDNTEKLLDSCHPTSSSTPSDPISTGINGTIQIANDGDLRASSFNEVTLGNEDVAAQLEGDEKTASEEQLGEKGEELEAANQKAEEEKAALKAQNNTQEVANLQRELGNRDKEIEKLNARVQQLEGEKGKLITELEGSTSRAVNKMAEVRELQEKFKTLQDFDQQLEKKEKEIAQLKTQMTEAERKNKELEAENKKIQQLKQGNGARYTATVGMGLAAGLIAFTALERTVRLDIWVMVGIAVVSTLAVGSITYAALPSTQVDRAGAQKVNEDNKGK